MSGSVDLHVWGDSPDRTIHGLAVPRIGVVNLIAEDPDGEPGLALVSLTPEDARKMARFLDEAAEVVSQ